MVEVAAASARHVGVVEWIGRHPITDVSLSGGRLEAGFVESAVRAAGDRPALSRIGAAARYSARALDWSGVVERFEDEVRSVVSPVSPGASVLPAMTAHTSPLR